MDYQFLSEERSLIVRIPKIFRPYTDSTVVKLMVLYPTFDFSFDDEILNVWKIDVTSISDIRTAIAHQLYREKILVETLSMRKALLSAVIR